MDIFRSVLPNLFGPESAVDLLTFGKYILILYRDPMQERFVRTNVAAEIVVLARR